MRAVMLAVLLAAPAVAAAPTKKTPPKPTAADAPDSGRDVAPVPTHNEGDYGGVQPGVPHRTEGHKAKRPPAKGTLSWIGFEEKAGGAEIFLQSVAPFEVAQHVDRGTLVVDLRGLDKLGHNTWRQVDTRFFDTPIARIVARRIGAARGKHAHRPEIEVRITFKNPKDAHEGALRGANGPDGMYYQYLSFAGSGGPAATTSDAPEK